MSLRDLMDQGIIKSITVFSPAMGQTKEKEMNEENTNLPVVEDAPEMANLEALQKAMEKMAAAPPVEVKTEFVQDEDEEPVA